MTVWLVEKRFIDGGEWEIDSTIPPQASKSELRPELFERKPYSRFEFRAAKYSRIEDSVKPAEAEKEKHD